MGEEYLIVGPPGTGKTSFVARQAKRAVEKHGRDSVMICSLTKAAASEIASRVPEVKRENVGTIHSILYHALGRPEIIETKEYIKEWNDWVGDTYRITSVGDEVLVDDYRSPGDRLYQKLSLCRARMNDRLPPDVRQFKRKWEDFKKANNLFDFQDIIEEGIKSVLIPPGSPSIIIVDEAQDLSRAEYTLIKNWMSFCNKVLIVGDKMQSLYSWRGADPDILDPTRVDSEHLRILSKSWRLPLKIKNAAMQLAACVEGPEGKIKYEAISDGGCVEHNYFEMAGWNLKDNSRIIEKLEEYIKNNKTVMLLASTNHLVRYITKMLREIGLPYHNPYTHRWNPLAGTTGTSQRERLLAYLVMSEHNPERRFWTAGELQMITENLNNVIKRGYKKKIQALDDDTPPEQIALLIHEMFKDESDRDRFLACDIDWWLEHQKKSDSLDYIKTIYKNRGVESLVKHPSIIVGTIHSVKGGEADVVFLFPDLSRKGMEQYEIPGFYNRDAIIRMFYVGMTRAKEVLHLCAPKGRQAFNWEVC